MVGRSVGGVSAVLYSRSVALIGTPSNWNEVAEALVDGFIFREELDI